MKTFFSAFLGLSAFLFSFQSWGLEPTLIRAQVEQLVQSQPSNVVVSAVSQIYRGRDFAPIFVQGNALNVTQYADLVSTINSAEGLGLNPSKYQTSDLLRASEIVAYSPVAIEIHLTAVFSSLLLDSYRGVLNPETFVDQAVRISQKTVRSMIELINPLIKGVIIPSQLVSFVGPQSEEFKALIALNQRLVNAAAPMIVSSKSLRLGMRSSAVLALRERLAVLGYPSQNGGSDLFTEDLRLAVIEFQKDFNLGSDGVVGPRSIAQLNQDLKQRARVLKINAERWRWLPRDLGKNYLLTSIGPNMLKVVRDNTLVQEMRVITGRPDRRTPMLIDRMSSININPFWNVPSGIKAKDIIPALLANPNYLQESRMEVLNSSWVRVQEPYDWSGVDFSKYEFRQKPGPRNSLGRIRFNLGNAFAIYLHDTAHPELFAEAMRNRSSGCVRVSDPVGLADILLAGSVTRTDLESRLLPIEDAPGYPINQRLSLPQSWPTYILYSTVTVNSLGRMVLTPDNYRLDEAMSLALGSAL